MWENEADIPIFWPTQDSESPAFSQQIVGEVKAFPLPFREAQNVLDGASVFRAVLISGSRYSSGLPELLIAPGVAEASGNNKMDPKSRVGWAIHGDPPVVRLPKGFRK